MFPSAWGDNEFIHANPQVKLNLSGSHLVNYNSQNLF